MKTNTAILISFLLFVSCGSNNKTKTHNPTPSKYISVIEGIDGFISAYTEDGHTILYETDSANNHVVYYAKFDDNAGKKGYDRVKDKAVRIEMDSSLSMVTSFVSVHGGASCRINDNGEFLLYYFDEQLNGKNVEMHEFHLEEQSEGKEKIESIISVH